MSIGAFDEVWKYARTMSVLSPDLTESRDFKGFLEYLNSDGTTQVVRTAVGTVPVQKFRLISEPRENFFCGKSCAIVCNSDKYDILSIKDIYIGEKISHRECVLRLNGEGVENA